MFTVLFVIDQPCFLRGFVDFIRAHGQAIHLSRQARTLDDGLAMAREMRPDVVVLDTTMSGCGPEDLSRFVAALGSPVNVLALADAARRTHIQQCFSVGVKGYLLKSAEGPDVVNALHTVSRGECYLDPHLVTAMMEDTPRMAADRPFLLAGEPHPRISERERAVLKRTAFGYSAKEIARDLAISQKSVETYRARAAAKLGLDSRSEIIRYANHCGWFSGSDEASLPH